MHEGDCGFASNQMQERTQTNAVYNASGVEHVYLYNLGCGIQQRSQNVHQWAVASSITVALVPLPPCYA
jgi:hypothetical protein